MSLSLVNYLCTSVWLFQANSDLAVKSSVSENHTDLLYIKDSLYSPSKHYSFTIWSGLLYLISARVFFLHGVLQNTMQTLYLINIQVYS